MVNSNIHSAMHYKCMATGQGSFRDQALQLDSKSGTELLSSECPLVAKKGICMFCRRCRGIEVSFSFYSCPKSLSRNSSTYI